MMGELFPKLYGVLVLRLARPAGPPRSIYHSPDFDPERLDVEAALPTRRLVKGMGEAQARVLPAHQALVLLHHGPYETIEQTYRALQQAMEAQGLVSAGAPYESYLVGPPRAKPEDYRTEVSWPVKPA